MPEVYQPVVAAAPGGTVLGLLTSVLLLVLCLVLCARYLHCRHQYWATRGVACPPATPLLGHTLCRMGLARPFMEFFDELYYNYNGRDFCGYYDLLQPGLFVGNPELIRSILGRDFDHFTDRRTFDLSKVNPVANDMLTNARGEHWRRVRGVVSPAFTAAKTRRLHPLVARRAKHLHDLAAAAKTSGPVEVRGLCGRYTMDTIASCAFGIDCEAMTNQMNRFPTEAAKIFQLSPVRAVKMLVLAVAPKLAQLTHRLGLQFTSAEFNFFREVVTHTLVTRRQTGVRRGDFLDLLMETLVDGEQALPDDTIAAQAILFLLAGYDNTANTLATALHLLAHHPHVQAAVRREVALAAHRGGGTLSHDTVMTLPYLEAVVSEVLRLYPAAPVIERVCTKRYRVGEGGVQVDAGTGVLVPVWSLHRDPHHWPQPHAFRPERFMGPARTTHAPYTYLPFGAGPRSCVGIRFAMLTVKVALAELVCGLEVTPDPACPHPLALDPRVLTLQPRDGVLLHLRPRDLTTALRRELQTYPATSEQDQTACDQIHRTLCEDHAKFTVSFSV